MNKPKTRAPRMDLSEETVNAFLERLRSGETQRVAIKGTGWSERAYYARKERDKKFRALIEGAIGDYYRTLNTANIALIKMRHPETVKHNIKRMDARENQHCYKQALIDAQKKAIAELDFERAERLQEQIEKAG